MLIRQRGVHLQRRHHVRGSSDKYKFRLFTTLIVPLLFGLFTIISTVYQHLSANHDRDDDLKRAADSRQADLNRFEAQRREDRNQSEIQRLDNLHIATEQRRQELNISATNQETLNKAAVNRYQDEVLVAYIKEIGDLMKEYNGSLTSNPLTATLARVKTLNVLRQLDGSRQTHVLRFLLEAKQLDIRDEFNALDISTAELTNINFQKVTSTKKITKMLLAGVHLRNCTFWERMVILHVNFTSSGFKNVNFSSISIDKVDFSSAEFRNANFSSVKISDTNFSSVSIWRTKFSSAEILYTNFSSANMFSVNFSSAQISYTNFSSAAIRFTTFSSARINNTNFSSAFILNPNFSSAQISYTNFSSAFILNTKFSSAELNYVDFSSVQFVVLPSNFHGAKMARTSFVKCNCERGDFSYANLFWSEFLNANLKNASFQNANLTQVSFSGANLWNADLTNTTITDSQLQSAQSIRNAKLPNGTLGRARNLIENGDANCNIPFGDPWHVQNGNISLIVSREDPNDCQFVFKSDVMKGTMWQRISLVNVWNSSIWTNSNVELHFSGGSGVSVELNALKNNGTVLLKEISNSTKNEIIMELQKDMHEIEVVVKFDAHSNNKYIWCDNIELFINYDMLMRNTEKLWRFFFG